MSEAVIVAIITSGVSLAGIIISNVVTASRSRQKILTEFHEAKAEVEKHQALSDQKIDTLADEVRMHNNFAQRIPVLEEKISVANHRIDDLEAKMK